MAFLRRVHRIDCNQPSLHVLVFLVEEPGASRELLLLKESTLFRLSQGSKLCLRGQRSGFKPSSAAGLLCDLASVLSVSGAQLSLLSSGRVMGWC